MKSWNGYISVEILGTVAAYYSTWCGLLNNLTKSKMLRAPFNGIIGKTTKITHEYNKNLYNFLII